MKKYAIAIIGLVFAALVFGACEIQKGGTIKIKNTKNTAVTIYITKDALDGLLTPPSKEIAKKSIAANGSGEISFDEDGTYHVRAFSQVLNTDVIPCSVKPSAIATLLAGNSVSVTVE
jgi:hypothetical protein